MGRVAERGEDLLARERVVLFDAFVGFTGAERPDDGRDVHAGPREAGLAEPDARIHRNARKDLHAFAPMLTACSCGEKAGSREATCNRKPATGNRSSRRPRTQPSKRRHLTASG